MKRLGDQLPLLTHPPPFGSCTSKGPFTRVWKRPLRTVGWGPRQTSVMSSREPGSKGGRHREAGGGVSHMTGVSDRTPASSLIPRLPRKGAESNRVTKHPFCPDLPYCRGGFLWFPISTCWCALCHALIHTLTHTALSIVTHHNLCCHSSLSSSSCPTPHSDLTPCPPLKCLPVS